MNIVPSWDIEGRELANVCRYPKRGTIFTDISAITLLLYSYKYFVSFSAVCGLKKRAFMMQESDSAQEYNSFSRDVRRHLKQRHATATCEGIRESVPISSKSSDSEKYRHAYSSAFIAHFNHLIFIAI